MSDSMIHGLLHSQTSLSFTSSQSLLKLMSIQSVMPSNHLIRLFPLVLLPSIFPTHDQSRDQCMISHVISV